MQKIGGFFAILKKYHVISILVIFLLPVYPTFSNYLLLTSTAQAQEDSESITLSEYSVDDSEDIPPEEDSLGGNRYIRANDPSVGQYATTNLTRLHVYRTQSDTTPTKIAEVFRVPTSMILWANNFEDRDIQIKAGTVVKIPPVSGSAYTIQSGDTLESIATKFGVEPSRILSDYGKLLEGELPVGEVVIVAGASQPVSLIAQNKQNQQKSQSLKVAEKPPVKPVVKVPEKITPKVADKKPPIKKSESLLETSTAAKKGDKTYKVVYTGLSRGFAWGNCTAYVAQNKTVTWRGNANQWIRNAKAQGVPTGKTPAVGSIIQFEGYGYNPYYGHVGIVVGIKDTKLIIKDMNYQKLNTVTIREIPKDHPAIKGYIYVD
ncbi:MAG: CHAP domain-containing protein [Candidatus Gracilibacteria bacterium]